MATLRSFTPEETFLMKKALYYDFMLYRRHLKPFNLFLLKNGLRSTMYSSPSTSTRGTSRFDDGLHYDLLSASPFNPNGNINLIFISDSFSKLDQDIFNPQTSEQIDQSIKTLVDKFTPGAPLYECHRDEIMKAIQNGRFDNFLSDENKEDMMRICYAGVQPNMEGEGEDEIRLPPKMRPARPASVGGRRKSKSKNKSKKIKKRNKSKSKIKSKKIKKRSKSKSKSKKGGAPASYVGSIQGEFINHNGQQLFRNPVGGIA